MANSVNVNEKVNVPAKQETTMTMRDWINKSEKQIAKALPSAITPERFARMAMTAVTLNPELGDCTPQSFIGAMLQAASLGLEPNTPLGQAYLIPYKNGKTEKKEGSYTTYLFEKGIDKILKKVGEESTEVIVAAKGGDKGETVYEIADLVYHVMVLMVEMGIKNEDILRELASRHVIDHKVKQETQSAKS